MEEIAVKVDNVSKDFKYTSRNASTIKNAFTSVFRRKENSPNDTQHALKNVSLEIKKGEFFGIVGRNGSGKSTLLKMIAGIYQPNKGSIKVEGKLVPFIELGVGFNPELTGKENVYLNGALLGFSKKEVVEMYDKIVEFAELEKFMEQKLKNYSSGMQVRLAFSMAVRAKADVLLIDEVLAVGDADFQRKCFDYFKKLKKNDTTVIFVSHDMDAVREYCDRAMLIEDSKVVMVSTTNKVAEQYLKLFTSANSQAGTAAHTGNGRWGDEIVKVKSVDVKVSKDNIIITTINKSRTAVESPIVGFRLRDGSGKFVTGTNTKIEGKYLGSIIAGSETEVQWSFPNLLSSGEYIVDVAVLHSDNITVSDWWDDAVMFKISKARHLPYSIDPGFKITIK